MDPPSPPKIASTAPPASQDQSDTAVNNDNSFPNPDTSPGAFASYLQSTSVTDFVSTWEHLNARPVRSEISRLLDEAVVTAWTDRVDTLLGRLSRVKRANPNYINICDVLVKACNDGIDAITTELRAQAAKLAEEMREKEEKEVARLLQKELMRKEKQELKEKLKKLEEAEDEPDPMDIDSASEGDVVVYDPPCKLCLSKDLVCQGPPGKACDLCRRDHKTCTQGVIRRPRKGKAAGKTSVVKQEPPSPQNGAQKRKADVFVLSDNEIEAYEFNDDSVFGNDKGKAKQTNAITNKARLDGVVITAGTGTLRKSTRVNRATGKAAKKVRIGPPHVNLPTDGNGNVWQRLASELLTVSTTLNEIGESMKM